MARTAAALPPFSSSRTSGAPPRVQAIVLLIALLAPLSRNARRRWIVATTVGIAVMLAGISSPVQADVDGTPAGARTGVLESSLVETVRRLALEKSQEQAPGAPRVEIVIGQLDPRLRLAPCQRIEPSLPAGMRLWGKARIGLRCTQGPTAWNVYLPITVKVWGKAMVVAAGGSVGSTVAAADLVEAEVDLAEEPTAAIVDPAQAVGRVLAQNLKAGQTLRQGHLKLRQFFAAGETVKVVAVGAGFSLESEGQALGNGVEGAPARVRIEGGRIVTGTPAGERRIEVAL